MSDLKPGQWVRHRPDATKGYELGKVLTIDRDGVAAIRFYRVIQWFFTDIDAFAAAEAPADDMDTPFERRRLWYLLHPEACHGRDVCPCCGYPTLLPVREFREEPPDEPDDGRILLAAAMDTSNCPLCLWFDRGRDDEDADLYDPVNDMTLAEARASFAVTQSMYPADAEHVFPRALQAPEVRHHRNRAIVALERLRAEETAKARQALWQDIESALAAMVERLEDARSALEAEEGPEGE
jgi:hypothetical protein